MKNAMSNSLEYLMEVDRMVNEGLGGGVIAKNSQYSQYELPEINMSYSELEKGDE